MIILISDFGQLGNRLFIFSKFLAFAIAEDVKIMNLGFSAYAKFFEGTQSDILCRYPPKKSKIQSVWFAQVLRRVFKWLAKFSEIFPFLQKWILPIDGGEKTLEMADAEFIASIKNKLVIFTGGWPRYSNPEAKQEAAKIVREYLKPGQKYVDAIDALIGQAKEVGDVVVGVHIRQGDYKDWDGGKYYFTTNQYNKIMIAFEKLFPDQKVVFLVVSDQDQQEQDFSVQNVIIGDGGIIEDLYVLSKCSYIIRTMSTFSGWASAYGYVPYTIIKDADADISFDNLVRF